MEKLKSELASLRERGAVLMKTKGARHKDVYQVSNQIDEVRKKIQNLMAGVH
jgi:uncharacterized protein involved in exopolysaccharide biosynthesis